MESKKTFLQRVAAGAGALALVATGMVALSTPAMAAVGPDQPGAPTQGTLTVNKYSGAPVAPGQTPEPENLLDDVEFTVTQVGRTAGGTCAPVDLTDTDAWDGLEGLFGSAPAAPATPFCLMEPRTPQATVNGSTTFTLPVGVYYVQETDPGDNNIVSPVPNFYVSIPTSESEEGEGWNYDVIADPKNQLMDEPSKTIVERPDALVVGSDITWNLSIPIPTLNNNETFTQAVIRDDLDARLGYASSTVTLDGAALVENTDYTVDEDGVAWTFTETGRTKLNGAMGGTINIALVTTVNSVGTGDIPNDDYDSTFNGTTVPGTTVPHSYWGQLDINKHDDSTPVQPLSGAEFQVFETVNDQCPAAAPGTGAVATGTSDANGDVQWANVTPTSPLGLWIANSDTPLTSPTNDYCVYETVVPAGHTASTIDNPVTIATGEEAVFVLDVLNAKQDGPDLPLTGAQGTLWMTLGGLLIIALGAAALMIARKRKANA